MKAPPACWAPPSPLSARARGSRLVRRCGRGACAWHHAERRRPPQPSQTAPLIPPAVGSKGHLGGAQRGGLCKGCTLRQYLGSPAVCMGCIGHFTSRPDQALRPAKELESVLSQWG